MKQLFDTQNTLLIRPRVVSRRQTAAQKRYYGSILQQKTS